MAALGNIDGGIVHADRFSTAGIRAAVSLAHGINLPKHGFGSSRRINKKIQISSLHAAVGNKCWKRKRFFQFLCNHRRRFMQYLCQLKTRKGKIAHFLLGGTSIYAAHSSGAMPAACAITSASSFLKFIYSLSFTLFLQQYLFSFFQFRPHGSKRSWSKQALSIHIPA